MIGQGIIRTGVKAARVSSMSAPIFKKSPGNSFVSFKEYRQAAKTYGPLSASLAQRRHLTHTIKH